MKDHLRFFALLTIYLTCNFCLAWVSNMFIVSLAIADLIVGLIVMPISATYIFTKDWIFGLVVCQFWIGVDYTASTASILNLFILSLDRYWSVTSPLKYLRKRTKKRAMIMISFVWVMSSLWLIPIIGWHHFEHDGVRTVPTNVCDTEYATNIVLKILTAILNFYLPLAIMFGLYTKIFLEIRKRSNLELGQHNIGGSNHYRSTHPSNTIPMTSSLTDDSNKSNEDEDEEDGEGDDAGTSTRYSPYSTMVEREQFIPGGVERGGGGSLRSTTEYETETGSDDDMRRLHRGGYTNLTLVQAANRLNNTTTTTTSGSDVPTSDNEVRIEYFYDETVVDSTTEKVHRFYDEHALPILRTGSSRTAETSLNSPNIPGRPQSSSFHWPKPKALVTYTNGTKGGRNGNPVVQHKSSFKIKSNKGKRRRRGSTVPGLIDFRRSAKNKHALEAALRRQARNALRQHDKRAKGGDKAVKKKPSAALAREIKAAKQLGVIMGAFTVCFCPYFVLFMVVAFCDGCISPGLMIAMTWVGYLNSTLNPFLYPLCNITFRRKFRCMLGLSRHRATDSPKSFATNSRYVMQQRSINGYPGGKR